MCQFKNLEAYAYIPSKVVYLSCTDLVCMPKNNILYLQYVAEHTPINFNVSHSMMQNAPGDGLSIPSHSKIGVER